MFCFLNFKWISAPNISNLCPWFLIMGTDTEKATLITLTYWSDIWYLSDCLFPAVCLLSSCQWFCVLVTFIESEQLRAQRHSVHRHIRQVIVSEVTIWGVKHQTGEWSSAGLYLGSSLTQHPVSSLTWTVCATPARLNTVHAWKHGTRLTSTCVHTWRLSLTWLFMRQLLCAAFRCLLAS